MRYFQLSESLLCRLIVLALTMGFASASIVSADDALKPSIDLSPRDVVRAQLRAMASNDANGPDSGIAIAFRFASPANKVQTGPVEKFATIVRNPAYVAMIDNTGLKFGKTVLEDSSALVPVIVNDPDGELFGYVFRLSRHSIVDCDRCWMTDSVAPIPTRDLADEKKQLL